MNSYNLGGHSGCKILLIEDDDGHVYVRKVSKDRDYNARLKIQSDKQASFDGNPIKAPKVLNSGYTTDGLFFFDMEYIQGITLAEYIKTIEIGKMKGLVEALVSSLVPREIPDMTEAEKIKVVETFSTKISGLRKTLSNANNKIVDQALDLLEAHDWSKLTPTQCHGDLTLENIIIKNDNMYFIDFLDSFYDSWFLDVGTLLQDVQAMWSYRFEKSVNMNTVLRLIVFRDLLLDEVQKIHSEYIVEIYYALLQKLLRIYPYTKDKRTYSFLNEKTKIVLDKIQMLERTPGGTV